MGTPTEPEKAILFTGLLFGNNSELLRTEERLTAEFGDLAAESGIFDWPHSNYYEDELGQHIKRKFLLFKKTINPEMIADIKLKTNDIENVLAKDNKRAVNIDPGYLTLSKLVLASTKNYCHRIYIGKGIYAEITLYYKNDDFHPTPFTYDDYRQDEYIEFFKRSREYLRDLI